MMKGKTSLMLVVIFAFTLVFYSPLTDSSVHAFSPQVIQQGASGEDVIELQARLKHIGFYNGKGDGVFGWGTYWALRNFQYEFGMDIDGIAGQSVKDRLVKTTSYDAAAVKKDMYGDSKHTNTKNDTTPNTSFNVPQGFSQNDITLMANAVHGEARGEPYEGQVAVAAVILNRTKDANFPDSISGVIFEPRAFTAVADGQIWLEPNESARRAVLDAINGWDP